MSAPPVRRRPAPRRGVERDLQLAPELRERRLDLGAVGREAANARLGTAPAYADTTWLGDAGEWGQPGTASLPRGEPHRQTPSGSDDEEVPGAGARARRDRDRCRSAGRGARRAPGRGGARGGDRGGAARRRRVLLLCVHALEGAAAAGRAPRRGAPRPGGRHRAARRPGRARSSRRGDPRPRRLLPGPVAHRPRRHARARARAARRRATRRGRRDHPRRAQGGRRCDRELGDDPAVPGLRDASRGRTSRRRRRRRCRRGSSCSAAASSASRWRRRGRRSGRR